MMSRTLLTIEQWESLKSHQAAARSFPPGQLVAALAISAKLASGMGDKA